MNNKLNTQSAVAIISDKIRNGRKQAIKPKKINRLATDIAISTKIRNSLKINQNA